jgi:hypothetical protein
MAALRYFLLNMITAGLSSGAAVDTAPQGKHLQLVNGKYSTNTF